MDEHLVTIARFEWLSHANLALCRLEACGIEAVLLDECTISLYWHWAKALGGLRLQVSPEDAEDALAILAEEPQPAAEPILTDREQVTGRAVRSAAFSIVSSYLILYAAWLLVPVPWWSGRLSATERRNIVLAAILIALTLVFPALLFFALKHMP